VAHDAPVPNTPPIVSPIGPPNVFPESKRRRRARTNEFDIRIGHFFSRLLESSSLVLGQKASHELGWELPKAMRNFSESLSMISKYLLGCSRPLPL